MLNRLMGRGSSVLELKAGLDQSTQTVRQIAHRVANASNGPAGGFASALQNANGTEAGAEVDLEKEMVSLADEQLRYEAATRLLEKVYQQIRSSVRQG